ncbi:MAG: NAD+ synthase [Proteobacteria bacterium]|nr:NAD+ synthase [Pseudomonadota bacterium]NOG60114.1 NAD+ synthase [Pseudomonadota bacterium]
MSDTSLNIYLAQLNLTVGDIKGNTKKIIQSISDIESKGNADVIIFPELSISSYPPEDLLLRPAFNEYILSALDQVIAATRNIHVIIGYPVKLDDKLYNACSLINEGKIVKTYYKQHLPNYGVFDEKRYFTAGSETCLFEIKGTIAALSICEDIWVAEPIQNAASAGAKIMFNINASPYHKNKLIEREKMISDRARNSNMYVVYTNLVGGQDELVFDGNSLVVNNQGEIVFHTPQFEEGLFNVHLDIQQSKVKTKTTSSNSDLAEEENIYNALVLGVRDYVRKNKFSGALIGLSGGIDSALTLSVAVDALGAENVEVLIMPSRYTANMSNEDACLQAKWLGVNYEIISIEQPFESFLDVLKPRFKDLPGDITEENIQARCRGILLMAASNKSGKLVLTTGNKSEMAVGYATLYGDMAGGYAPLKDVWKTLVYKLALWRNTKQPVIPERVISRAPSAELRHDQIDQDSLPDYDILDSVLEQYIELDIPPEKIIKNGYDADVVYKIIRLVDINEYKRRQAAPGVRITERAFGRDRRYPITSGYIEK